MLGVNRFKPLDVCLFTVASEPRLHRLTSDASIAMSAGSKTNGLTRRPSFHINAVTGAVIGAGDSQVPIASHESRNGVLSWLGC